MGQINQPAGQKAARISELDALRGLIMVLMALDHANHFVAQKHSSGEYWAGLFPAYHDGLAFLTRFVTHLAAPGFFFLMGAGMWLFARSRQKQGWGRWTIIRHFLLRGSLLILAQFLIVNRAWELSPSGWGVDTYVGVLFALGGTMIVASLLLWTRPAGLLALSLVLLIGTELLVPAASQVEQSSLIISTDRLRLLLYLPGGTNVLWSNYPVLPWLELVVFGMAFGHWVLTDRDQAYARAVKLGALFILAFLALRYLDGFGNIRPRAGDGWIDFLNVVKYPPSITFTLMTTGINLMIIGAFGKLKAQYRQILQPLVTFGRTPLFFYVTHLFLYAAMGIILTPDGTSIPRMIPYWILGLVLLYPLCVGYDRVKHGRSTHPAFQYI